MPVTVRALAPSDKPAVMRILANTPEFLPFEIPVAEEVLDAYLEDPEGSDYRALVAEHDGAMAGYVCYGPTPLTLGTWDMYWMAVTRELQGKGVGQQLVKAAEEDMRRAKGRLCVIETSSKQDYDRTRRFYITSGYQQVCEIRDFYAPGDSKVMFVKGLQ